MSATTSRRRRLQREARANNTWVEHCGFVPTSPSYPTAPNPEYGRAAKLIEMRQEFRDLALKCRQLAMKFATGKAPPNHFDMVAAMHDPEFSSCNRRYRELVSILDKVPDTQAVQPAPPPRKELYGKLVVGANVVDIGCGTDERVTKNEIMVKNLNYVGVDPAVVKPRTEEKLKTFKARIEECPFVMRTAVSYMVLTQLSEAVLSEVEERDGIHIYPDCDQLMKMGVSRRIGAFYANQAKDRSFKDRRVDIPGYNICPGYKCSNTFSRKHVRLKYYDDPIVLKPFAPDARPDMDMLITEDIGWKHDGVCKRIEVRNGKTTIRDRSGKGFNGICDDIDFTAMMDVEECDVNGTPVFILIRLNIYRDYVPFHSGDCLRYFLDRVQVEIGGRPLYAPVRFPDEPKYGKFVVPTDGIIKRVKQRDFYAKYVWTFDSSSIDEVLERLEDEGFEFVYDDQEPPDGVVEYSVTPMGDGRIRVRRERLRTDKGRGENVADIVFKLKQLF